LSTFCQKIIKIWQWLLELQPKVSWTVFMCHSVHEDFLREYHNINGRRQTYQAATLTRIASNKKHIRKHPPRSTERLYSPQYRHWWMAADLTGYGVWLCLLRWRHVLSWRDRCRAAVIHARVTAESVIKHVQSLHVSLVSQQLCVHRLRMSHLQAADSRPTGP